MGPMSLAAVRLDTTMWCFRRSALQTFGAEMRPPRRLRTSVALRRCITFLEIMRLFSTTAKDRIYPICFWKLFELSFYYSLCFEGSGWETKWGEKGFI